VKDFVIRHFVQLYIDRLAGTKVKSGLTSRNSGIPSLIISITSSIIGSFRVGSFSIIANFWASDNEAGRVVLLRRTVRFFPPSEPSLRRFRSPRAWAVSPEMMERCSISITQFEDIRYTYEHVPQFPRRWEVAAIFCRTPFPILCHNSCTAFVS